MNLKQTIEDFIDLIQNDSIEIYNEAALQYELAIYLRDTFPPQYNIQLERNISFLGFNKNNFSKKEIDILVFKNKEDIKDIYIVELKAVVNQKAARPVTVFNWIEDLKFLEQLKAKGIGKCFSLFITDHPNYFSGNKSAGKLLTDFRSCKIEGTYKKHKATSNNNKSITLNSKYSFEWREINCNQKYFLIEI